MPVGSVWGLVRSLVRSLDQARIKFAITGGVAVGVWGEPRSTSDVDIILQMRPDDAPRLARALRQHGLQVAEDDIRDAVTEHTHFTVFDPRSKFHADCLPAARSGHQASIHGRRRIEVRGIRLAIVSPEDLIANKLAFGTRRDIADAQSIVDQQGVRLRWRVLEERCQALGVSAKLRRLRRPKAGDGDG